jgi:hypothetical protein
MVYVSKPFFLLFVNLNSTLRWRKLSLKLKVDGKEIPLNEFVEKILNGTITGAVGSLKGIKDGWKKIEIEVQK